MFEDLGRRTRVIDDDFDQIAPEVDLDALQARYPWAIRHFVDDPDDWTYDPAILAELESGPPPAPERDLFEEDRPLHQRDPDTLSDPELTRRLVQVEEDIASAHALRAQLVALLAANRPASADRPDGQPGAAVGDHTDAVPEVLEVSEWLAHELQMAHPYSLPAAQALVETSLVLTGRLSATLGLLRAGRIDYRRAQILSDLLGTCSVSVAHTVEGMVLPRAAGLTPAGLSSAVRRALARVDAAALRRRHARARRAADVGYWPTQDGMARLVADLPLPVAAACCDAISGYTRIQKSEGDTRPIGQIRTEVLTDLILRPWDTTRPPVTAQVTIHLTIPTTTGQGASAGLDDGSAEAELDGQIITAAQCSELLSQLHTSRLFLALHHPHAGLTAVATPAQLRRAARRHNRRSRSRGSHRGAGSDGSGLRPPQPGTRYRPTRAQDRHIRTRDRSCRHFGCTRKAVHADLDHSHPWPHGQTTVCNLCTYCRTHHRLKHQAPGWTRHLHPDATLTITTPTANTRTTRPPGPASDPDWPAPALPTRPTQTPDPPGDDPPPF